MNIFFTPLKISIISLSPQAPNNAQWGIIHEMVPSWDHLKISIISLSPQAPNNAQWGIIHEMVPSWDHLPTGRLD